MSTPRILVITSGHETEGRGHLSRMITLADALARDGASVRVEVLRGNLTAAQAHTLERAGVSVTPDDAEAADPDAVVVDLPDPNEGAVGRAESRLVVFDDTELFRGSAAIVVQPSQASWSGPGRADRVLAGSTFAPIRSGLRRLAADPPPPADPAEIVVCFGGSDPADVSGRLVPAIADAVAGSVDPRRATIVAIVGPGYGGTLGSDDRWTLLRDPADLDERLARATIAVVGGGTMKAEVAHLGVPALIVAVSGDQLPVAPTFAATGAARYLGDGRTIDPGDVGVAVTSLLADTPTRRTMARAGRAAVDGRGAERVAAAILAVARSR